MQELKEAQQLAQVRHNPLAMLGDASMAPERVVASCSTMARGPSISPRRLFGFLVSALEVPRGTYMRASRFSGVSLSRRLADLEYGRVRR